MTTALLALLAVVIIAGLWVFIELVGVHIELVRIRKFQDAIEKELRRRERP